MDLKELAIYVGSSTAAMGVFYLIGKNKAKREFEKAVSKSLTRKCNDRENAQIVTRDQFVRTTRNLLGSFADVKAVDDGKAEIYEVELRTRDMRKFIK